MVHAYQIDADGKIAELYRYKNLEGDPEHISVLTGLVDGREVWETLPASDFVLVDPVEGFYEPRWVDGAWREGLTAEEITAKIEAQNSAYPSVEQLEAENDQLRGRLAEIEKILGIGGKGSINGQFTTRR